MGYDITVGEYYEEKETDRSIWRHAKEVKLDYAPAFGEPTDNTNSRWPSYSGWAEFCRFVELPINLTIPQHPGIKKITKELQSDIDKSLSNFLLKYPDAVAKQGKDCDYHLARLTWLKFWVDWAINNCDNPVIANS